MTRRRTFGFAIALVLLAATAQAQTATSYQANYYNVGAPAPLQSETFNASAAVCNQAPPPVTAPVNPTRLVYDDTANAGKVCIISDAVGGVLLSLPAGSNYEGTLAAINVAGASAESARAPFSRLAVPPVPTNFKLVR